MSSVIRTVRTFVKELGGLAKVSANLVSSRWSNILRNLRRSGLAFGDDIMRLGARVTNGVVTIGRTSLDKFVRLVRRGRAVDAFENAAGTSVKGASRRALNRLDDAASRSFPDLSVAARDANVAGRRSRLVGVTGQIFDINSLEEVIRKNALLSADVRRATQKAISTKRIIMLGSVIAVTAGAGLLLQHEAVKYAKANSGCFVYTSTGDGNVIKCRARGCSCPIFDTEGTVQACNDNDLPKEMRVDHSECNRADAKGRLSYCVHCVWDVDDVEHIDYVPRDGLPENCMVKCEQMDALDALNEMIGGTLGDAWTSITNVKKGIGDSIGGILRFMPYVFGFVIVIIIAVAIAFVAKLSKRVKGAVDALGNPGT